MTTIEFCDLMRSLTDNDLVLLQDMNLTVKLEVDKEIRPGYDPQTVYLKANADCKVFDRLYMALRGFTLIELAAVNQTLAKDGLKFLLIRRVIQYVDPETGKIS